MITSSSLILGSICFDRPLKFCQQEQCDWNRKRGQTSCKPDRSARGSGSLRRVAMSNTSPMDSPKFMFSAVAMPCWNRWNWPRNWRVPSHPLHLNWGNFGAIQLSSRLIIFHYGKFYLVFKEFSGHGIAHIGTSTCQKFLSHCISWCRTQIKFRKLICPPMKE